MICYISCGRHPSERPGNCPETKHPVVKTSASPNLKTWVAILVARRSAVVIPGTRSVAKQRACTKLRLEDALVIDSDLIPPTHPTADAVRQALAKVAMEGGWRVYHGPYSEQFRTILASALNREFVRLCCSGTFAVELAIRALHLGDDAEVMLAGYDYPGNFRAIQDAGCEVCLCDVAASDWVPTVMQLEAAVGANTQAVIVSHLHGSLAPMASICNWAEKRGILVIEDACQAHGATVDGKPVGSWGHASVLSFGGSKLIASGRGGAVLTNDARMAQRMTVYCERGNDAYALSELQAAIAIPQYAHLQTDHQLRLASAQQLVSQLSRSDWLSVVSWRKNDQPAFYKLGMMIRDSIRKSRQLGPFLVGNSGSEDTSLAAARAVALKLLQKDQIEVGAGFHGFVRRSSSRCRKPVPLENSRIAAEATLVLHHSHLLCPETGGVTIEQVKRAFDRIEIA